MIDVIDWLNGVFFAIWIPLGLMMAYELGERFKERRRARVYARQVAAYMQAQARQMQPQGAMQRQDDDEVQH